MWVGVSPLGVPTLEAGTRTEVHCVTTPPDSARVDRLELHTVENSLVTVEPTVDGGVRYRFQEAMRVYAQERTR
jgi:hypothetical protein